MKVAAISLTTILILAPLTFADGAALQAGVAKVDITDRTAGPVNDPLYVKALVMRSDATELVLITIDAVAIGEIGRIGNEFLGNVRSQLQSQLGIPPAHVVINASHCHGVVRADIERLTVQAVSKARQRTVHVTVGAGVGYEGSISENRRLTMNDGSQVDMRRAYAMPPDEDVAGVGPIDPQVGLLRLDREDGSPLAVLYNFACHPIMGVPSGGNTADIPGFASKVIEEGLGDGTVALFVQGCAGDVNPARYKDATRPHDAESLGNTLGLSVLRSVKQIETKSSGQLKITNQRIALPRATDIERRIAAILDERQKLVQSLSPTDINFKTFLPLLLQHSLSPEFPSYYSQGYLHDQAFGRDGLVKLDNRNRGSVRVYLRNIQIMEQLTRLNVNLGLLKKHLARNQAAEKPTVDAEIVGLRIGDFAMVTFPGELSVEIGLNLKKLAPFPCAFVAGYANGYIYYLPTAAQRVNTGYAQEDCDCLVAPEWQEIFEAKALEVLKSL